MTGHHIACYSGGHSSAIVAIEVVRKFGKDAVVLLNHNMHPRSESADIKRFKSAVSDYLGVPITYCNAENWDTKDQFDVVIEAGAFQYKPGNAICTGVMKTQPFESWLKVNGRPDDVIYYGFDAKETNRIQRRSSHMALLGYKTDYPIALWENRTIKATEEIGIPRPTHYELFRHANCIGCLKAGKQHWYVVYCLYPDVWNKALLAEDLIGHHIVKEGFLSEMIPLFDEMKKFHVEPTEAMPSETFWARAKGLIKYPLLEDLYEPPCECSF